MVFGFYGYFFLMLSSMFEHYYIWTPAVLGALYACVCIYTCSTHLSMFHLEKRSRNRLIIIAIMSAPLIPNPLKNEQKQNNAIMCNRWTKRCTEWQPRRGKRLRGRPSRRWQDDITEKEGTTWIRKATDRQQWKALMEGYILQWMDKA